MIDLRRVVMVAGLLTVMDGAGAETMTETREAIALTAEEKHFVLAEMRGFLESVQKITQGIAGDDMQLVADAARRAGKNARTGAPRSLAAHLPMPFKKLGMDTHRRFDAMALDAEQLGDAAHALGQMSRILDNCTACHRRYRLISRRE